MDEKIAAIRKALSKNFNAAPVRYLDGEGCHHFDLQLPRVTHRVNFTLEVVETHAAVRFKRLCKEVTTHLQRNPTGRPRQVLVTTTGVQEESVEEPRADASGAGTAGAKGR